MMAGPGKRGGVARGGEIALAGHHALVVKLRAAGWSYPKIARQTGYAHSTCIGIVQAHLAEVSPSAEDADRIRARLFAEAETAKEQLVPYIFVDEEALVDLKGMAEYRAWCKEQAELYHLHGKQDDITHHAGDENVLAEEKANRSELLQKLLHERGLDGQPPQPVIEVPSEDVPSTNGHSTNGHSSNGHP